MPNLDKHAFFHIARTSLSWSFSKPEAWWRYIIMLLVVVLLGIFTIGSILSLAIMFIFADDWQEALKALAQAQSSGIDMENMGMAPGASLGVVVASFAAGLAALLLFVKPLHGRPFQSIITGAKRIRWKRIGIGFGLWLGISIVLEIVNYSLAPADYTLVFDGAKFWPALIAAIILLPLQTSFEEIGIRGYMMQALGVWWRSPFLALLVSSLFFGLLHFANPEVASYGPSIMIYYIGTGVFLGLITLMDEGLELALGVHFANNLYAASGVSYPDSVFVYPSVMQMNEMDMEGSLVTWFIMASVMTLAFAFIFKWKNWEKIFGTITMPSFPTMPEHIAKKLESIGEEA
ncbi:MAG: lysostaphin resistance A-like protein [Bacteroidia bacterium]